MFTALPSVPLPLDGKYMLPIEAVTPPPRWLLTQFADSNPQRAAGDSRLLDSQTFIPGRDGVKSFMKRVWLKVTGRGGGAVDD